MSFNVQFTKNTYNMYADFNFVEETIFSQPKNKKKHKQSKIRNFIIYFKREDFLKNVLKVQG